MFVILALFLGALLGALRARARGGSRFDIAQYAAAHGIALALLALFATVIWVRLG